MRNKLLAGAMALALVGCGEKPADEAATTDTPAAESVAEEGGSADAAATPRIGVEAAPGVAFDYAYTFRLADKLISKVQEEHAAACETLGVQRCRIVDVRYQLTDEKLVEAQTQFKLEPGIARKFGAKAIESVEKAEGVLADASVAGEDVGTEILASQQRSAGSEAEIARLEERLKAGGLSKSERAEILAQIGQLRGQVGDERQSRRSGEARIAWTSVAFNYVSDGGLPGIGHENPFSDAGETLMRSGSTALTFILTLGAVVLPWGVLAMLVIAFWRSRFMTAVRRQMRNTKPGASDPATPPAS
ncbi:DUF4349 domain-containing protein [Sphingopyxis sp. BSN-002]|uniref:DUF4349 domain-containing protein n=1 Tax=Sphingopyxis sp. BSN-002 TaxID=2911495 RepID=UPI001EDA857D|nr:DUF4349 domain-containing protein [Sphingopyxis sp. BSN-002]UKK84890.1 DUF4349 domain-containing protein [Sphingopyxis sp. BSN-002]